MKETPKSKTESLKNRAVEFAIPNMLLEEREKIELILAGAEGKKLPRAFKKLLHGSASTAREKAWRVEGFRIRARIAKAYLIK